jgi:hypothetical protein
MRVIDTFRASRRETGAARPRVSAVALWGERWHCTGDRWARVKKCPGVRRGACLPGATLSEGRDRVREITEVSANDEPQGLPSSTHHAFAPPYTSSPRAFFALSRAHCRRKSTTMCATQQKLTHPGCERGGAHSPRERRHLLGRFGFAFLRLRIGLLEGCWRSRTVQPARSRYVR